MKREIFNFTVKTNAMEHFFQDLIERNAFTYDFVFFGIIVIGVIFLSCFSGVGKKGKTQ